MSTLAITTHSINGAFADLLRPFSAKEIARRLRLPSARTVENWKEGRTSPQAKHVVAMLADDELCKRLLVLARQDELARQREMDTLNRRIEALKAEEKRHGEETHAITKKLAERRQRLGREDLGADGRDAHPLRKAVAEDRGAVSGLTSEKQGAPLDPRKRVEG